MTIERAAEIKAFGEDVGVLVNLYQIDGEWAVAYGDNLTKNEYRAFRELIALDMGNCPEGI